MTLLILMRHGQSEWNKKNIFTGWVDIPLSEKGMQEAIEGGKAIADLPIDVIFTSTLIRAQMTGMLAMLQHHAGKIPVIQHQGEGKLQDWATNYGETETIPVYEAWELNERYYGELQGLNKDATREKYGADQVHIWRRSYATQPPGGEALKDTAERTLPYFREKIIPALEKGQNVFVPAHGNSLRSIAMELDSLSHEEVVKLEIPTGIPIIYEYTGGVFTKR
jgi:2,3-bisphosphoglycerate-dependent phosphoglycerate mutase